MRSIDNLIEKGKQYEKKKMKMRQEQDSKSREETYNFKPQLQTNNYRSSKLEERDQHNVFDNLYTKKDYKNQRDLTTEDIEYERSKNELSFRPNLNKKGNNK